MPEVLADPAQYLGFAGDPDVAHAARQFHGAQNLVQTGLAVAVPTVNPGNLGSGAKGKFLLVRRILHFDQDPRPDTRRTLLNEPRDGREARGVGEQDLPLQPGRRFIQSGWRVKSDDVARLGAPGPGSCQSAVVNHEVNVHGACAGVHRADRVRPHGGRFDARRPVPRVPGGDGQAGLMAARIRQEHAKVFVPDSSGVEAGQPRTAKGNPDHSGGEQQCGNDLGTVDPHHDRSAFSNFSSRAYWPLGEP
ncbi:hypothetical protein D3C73_1155040 [compost metagenome]